MGHNTLVVYNDIAKRFILLPEGEGIPASGIALSQAAGNSLSKKTDGLYGASVDHMEWNGTLSQLVIFMTDGTSHSVPLPTSSSPPLTEEWLATQPGVQEITLTAAAKSTGHRLFINGLRQPISGYSVAGASLTLPSALSIEVGDVVVLDYYQL